MIDGDSTELIKQGDRLFGSRGSLMDLWQDSAENFYPERADFQTQRAMGDAWADGLITSQPIIIRRELGNQFSAMLRPRGTEWMAVSVEDDDDLDSASIGYLQDITKRQLRLMYSSASGFVEATKHVDHDYVTFGQGVLKVERNYRDKSILVRSRHLRDVVWSDDFAGRTDTVHEKWKPTAWDLVNSFAESKLHRNVIKAAKTDPGKVFECRHIVIPAKRFTDKQVPPFVSLYIDVENQHAIERTPSQTLKYVIPRWQTVSGSQYSYSQAVLAGLPSARTLQAITLTLLEAGENYVLPPMIAVQEALRGDLNMFSGGVTYVDSKYDERLGEVLRPLTQDRSGYGFGIELLDRMRAELNQCFFLDKLSITQGGKDMTAYEVSQIISEHVRNNLPLFEPVEHNYNAPLCEMFFQEAMGMGFFGSPDDVPEGLRGRDVKFKFVSPLQEQNDRLKAGRLVESIGLAGQVAQIDPSAVKMIETKQALRESLRGLSVPEDWLRNEDELAELERMEMEARQEEQMLAQAGQMAAVAEQGGKAGMAIKEAVA